MSTRLLLFLAVLVSAVQPLAHASAASPPRNLTVPEEVADRETTGTSRDLLRTAGAIWCDHDASPEATTACGERKPSSTQDPSESARLRDAVWLFTQQGLQLPDVTVSFHDSVEGCKGHYGLYEPETQHVHVCSDADYILPHELAHAWMVEHLDDATEQAFLDLRGLDAWADPDDEWRARGVEDAAILISMVLTENGGPENSPGWSERRRAFELLTGKPHQVIDHRPKPGRTKADGPSGYKPLCTTSNQVPEDPDPLLNYP